VPLQLAVHVVIVQPSQVIREPLVLDRQQPEKGGLSHTLTAHQTEHAVKLTSRLEHPLDGSQQEDLHGFASVLVLRSTEEVMQDMGNPFRVVQRLTGTGPAHRLYNVDALAQQVQPDGIGKHMVVLQNRDAILDRSLYLSVGVLGEHFFHIFNGSGSAFFADFFAQ